MLKSFIKSACALAAATTLWAGAAQADNHSVFIMDGAYFPSVIYARKGDNVIFTNQSGAAHTVTSADGSWTSESIGVDGTFRLNLSGSTVLDFVGVGPEGEDMVGYVTFEPAPLSE